MALDFEVLNDWVLIDAEDLDLPEKEIGLLVAKLGEFRNFQVGRIVDKGCIAWPMNHIQVGDVVLFETGSFANQAKIGGKVYQLVRAKHLVGRFKPKQNGEKEKGEQDGQEIKG